MRARAFPGISSSRKVFPGVLLTCTDPIPGAKEGENADLGGAVERRRKAGLGAALEAECATGAAVDGFARMKKHAAEPVAAAEGDARGGASTAERMRMPPGACRCQVLHSQ